MSTELRAVSRVFIRCMGLSLGRYGHYRATVRMYSRLKPEPQLQQLGSCEWSSERVKPLSYRSKFTRICCDIQPAISSPIRGRTLGRWRITSVIAICNQQRDTLHWRLIGLRASGRINLASRGSIWNVLYLVIISVLVRLASMEAGKWRNGKSARWGR
jgi:hypothetical protein